MEYWSSTIRPGRAADDDGVVDGGVALAVDLDLERRQRLHRVLARRRRAPCPSRARRPGSPSGSRPGRSWRRSPARRCRGTASARAASCRRRRGRRRCRRRRCRRRRRARRRPASATARSRATASLDVPRRAVGDDAPRAQPVASAIHRSSSGGSSGASAAGRGGGRTHGFPWARAARSLRPRRPAPAIRAPPPRPRAARAAAPRGRGRRPFRTSARPASNCGFTSTSACQPGRREPRAPAAAPSAREMNDTSQVTSCGANGSSSSVRAFVRSSTVTRGSLRIRGCSWPCPTSSAITRAAPRWSRTSVNPPVEAPRSRQSRPAGSTPNASSAFASLTPARETYGGGRSTSSGASTRRPARRASRGRARAPPSRAPAPAPGSRRGRARRAARRAACASRGARGEPGDHVGEHRRVGRNLGEPRVGALGGRVGELARRLLSDLEHVAVAVEDVVHDLEEQPELRRERPPRRVLASAAHRRPRRRT